MNESRTIRAGHVTIEVVGDPIEHNLDARALGVDVAAAIAAAIAAGIKGITQVVSSATITYREKARRALAKGAPWAVARYASGRAPGSSSTMFNDSGELVAGVGVKPDGDGFAVTVPGDRLASNLPGASTSAIEKLVALVPALRDPFSVPAVRAAIEASWRKLIHRRR